MLHVSEQQVLNNRYEIGELIGRGGMADVYLGHDQRLGRQVAIKMMRPDLARDPQFQTRFQREAHSSAALNHPNIVAVFDTGEERLPDTDHTGVSCPFMIMEYVSGSTLRTLLRSSEVSIDDAVHWMSGVLAALNYSHEHDIVHRDIKPANVMVTETGDVKVMDFGIARALSDSSTTMTQTQAVVGTAQYLSPEQARGEQVDYRSDLYSAGCVLFELVTGRPPFVGESPVSVAYQHVREDPPMASTINPDVTPALEAVITKALSKDPDDRFDTGADFAQALENAHYHGIFPDHDEEATTQHTTVLPAAVPMAGPGSEAEATQAFSTVSATESEQDPLDPFAPNHDDEGYVVEDLDEPQPRKKKKSTAWIWIVVLLLLSGAGVAGWWFYQDWQQQQIEQSQVTVPDVAGMSQTDAQNALTTAGLRPVIENVHDDEIAADIAVGTDPAAGETLQEYDEITLKISMGPEEVVLPEDLAGASEATVRDTLEGLGLRVDDINYVNSATVDRDRLVNTNPELGSTVSYGATISLQMSNGQVEVPDVIGRSQADAVQALEADGVGLSANVETEETDEAQPDTVIKQSVTGGNTVDQGSTITITVAIEPPEPTPTDEQTTAEPSPEEDTTSPEESEPEETTSTPEDEN
ncbi:Stk1 family PASTA domain-containing Ser/Thr kinase [Auritidibacter sp. NML130574]|nr:Stk1 family PASTA domain-containing Ser/Thr kinase [Auritidibacter sp. NML130574]PXA79332.1 Stk1 family PASTA domain-containing Ser/Thr kinase [Auritidibacter sp. NML120636]